MLPNTRQTLKPQSGFRHGLTWLDINKQFWYFEYDNERSVSKALLAAWISPGIGSCAPKSSAAWGAAFRPFSPGLWLAMLSVVISTSLMITYFEARWKFLTFGVQVSRFNFQEFSSLQWWRLRVFCITCKFWKVRSIIWEEKVMIFIECAFPCFS